MSTELKGKTSIGNEPSSTVAENIDEIREMIWAVENICMYSNFSLCLAFHSFLKSLVSPSATSMQH